MRILVFAAFSGLTQHFYSELSDTGYEVSVELHLRDESRLQPRCIRSSLRSAILFVQRPCRRQEHQITTYPEVGRHAAKA
ncbi:hypothetical protein QLH52_05845 [Methylomonas sp. OY6]|uniref:Uncharacterized protein n=1 Tax=Methylomonas defluvii TaxID=3045149 RepID=A0ABU4UBQ1_9GAMM|nr:hypothetical protein [Methylomonas sp. OY6]MDX8126795.1 hypothetical protein [Methylomonas sp. OY6]